MNKVLKSTALRWKLALITAGLLARLLTLLLPPAPPTPPSTYHIHGSYHPKEGVELDIEKRQPERQERPEAQ